VSGIFNDKGLPDRPSIIAPDITSASVRSWFSLTTENRAALALRWQPREAKFFLG
jgi:hypothetical protein